MSEREINAIKLGLKTKEEMHNMTIAELEEYEDTLYWNRSEALTMINYLRKFGSLKLLKAPEEVTVVEYSEEEE